MTVPNTQILQYLDGLLTQGKKDDVMNYLKSLPDDERKELRKHLAVYNAQKESRGSSGDTVTTSSSPSKRMVSPRTTDAGDSGRMKSQAGSLGKNSTSQGSPLRNGLTQSDNNSSNSPKHPSSPLARSTEEGAMNKYNLSDLLGKGQFSKVYKATNTQTGQLVAVKQIEKEMLSPDKLPAIMKEAELLQTLSHENIVRLVEVCDTRQHLYFVLEYIDGGSLYKCVKKHGVFPEPLLAFYIAQVLQGLKYLHDKGVIHRDIKGSNILMRKDGKVKLADFGSCTESAVDKRFTVVGTPYWMAPEIIAMHGGSTLSDIWSVGCTVIELLTGSPPYFELGTMAALFHMVEDEHPPLPDNCSAELRSFLLMCFRKDIKQRPSISSSHDVKDTVRRYNAERRQNSSSSRGVPALTHAASSPQLLSGGSTGSSAGSSSGSRPGLASLFDSSSSSGAPSRPPAISSPQAVSVSSTATIADSKPSSLSSASGTHSSSSGKSLLGFISSSFAGDKNRTNSPKPPNTSPAGSNAGSFGPASGSAALGSSSTQPPRESTASGDVATMLACLPDELKLKLKEIARANVSKQMVEQMHRDLDTQLRSLTDDRQNLMKSVEDLRKRVESLKAEKEQLTRERNNLQLTTESMVSELRGANAANVVNAAKSSRPNNMGHSNSAPSFDPNQFLQRSSIVPAPAAAPVFRPAPTSSSTTISASPQQTGVTKKF